MSGPGEDSPEAAAGAAPDASPFRLFLIAAQFLTRFPLPWVEIASPREIGRSAPLHPLVGLLLGVVLAGIAAAAATRAPPLLAAALTLAAWVAGTGGLHLDGLADCADAWACGGGRERMLTVMKDPNCGPAAVSVTTVVLILKFAALAALIERAAWIAIALAPALARAGPLVLFLTVPYVRPGGLGSAMAAHLPRRTAWAAVALAAAGAAVMGSAAGVCAAAAAAGALILLRRALLARLGGFTGDAAGAAVELVEAAALVAAVLC